MADDETNKKIRDTIKSAKEAVQDVIVNAQLEKLERTPGNTIREACVSPCWGCCTLEAFACVSRWWHGCVWLIFDTRPRFLLLHGFSLLMRFWCSCGCAWHVGVR
jgi:hypothetical protein